MQWGGAPEAALLLWSIGLGGGLVGQLLSRVSVVTLLVLVLRGFD